MNVVLQYMPNQLSEIQPGHLLHNAQGDFCKQKDTQNQTETTPKTNKQNPNKQRNNPKWKEV